MSTNSNFTPPPRSRRFPLPAPVEAPASPWWPAVGIGATQNRWNTRLMQPQSKCHRNAKPTATITVGGAIECASVADAKG